MFDNTARTMPGINMTALIDVVFILLIFVVLAANFDRLRELDVQLPTAEETVEMARDTLAITVLPQGTVRVMQEEIAVEDLRERLMLLSADFEKLTVMADGSVPLQLVVGVLDDAAAAGFPQASLATARRQ